MVYLVVSGQRVCCYMFSSQSWSWRVSGRVFVTRTETKGESKEANDSDSLQEGKRKLWTVKLSEQETAIETVGVQQEQQEDGGRGQRSPDIWSLEGHRPPPLGRDGPRCEVTKSSDRGEEPLRRILVRVCFGRW